MRKIRFRILDALSRDVSTSLSIRGNTKKIQELHGTAHYKNIYYEIQKLQGEGLVGIKKTGKASMIHLRFESLQLGDYLAEMELDKKQKSLYPRKDLTLVVSNVLDKLYPLKTSVVSILGIDLEKNSKLNRVELVILLSDATIQMQRKRKHSEHTRVALSPGNRYYRFDL